MRIFALICTAGLLIASSASDVTKGNFGAAKQDEPIEKPQEKSDSKSKQPTYPFYGTLDSVDPTQQTITLRGKKKNRVIHFTADTRIQRNGALATAQDAIPGERVSGAVRKNAEGKEVALSIRLGIKAARD